MHFSLLFFSPTCMFLTFISKSMITSMIYWCLFCVKWGLYWTNVKCSTTVGSVHFIIGPKLRCSTKAILFFCSVELYIIALCIRTECSKNRRVKEKRSAESEHTDLDLVKVKRKSRNYTWNKSALHCLRLPHFGRGLWKSLAINYHCYNFCIVDLTK